MEEEKERSRVSIDQMYDKYQEDPYMISKINHYLQKQLPILLENTKNTREQNIQRIEDLSLEQEQFIQSFLHRNNYFYVSTTEKFVYYDRHHYGEITEDHVLYNILNSISQERNPKLMSWKYKTKVSIFKRIKENKLTKTIPESETIQNVLGHFLSNKSETKYFLTILGDNIMKKNPTHIHFFDNTEIKLFLKELNQTSVYFFGNQCTQTFKTKMHEKHYEDDMKDCRMISIDIMENGQVSFLDILCVACHYSVRYGNADHYLVRDTDLEKKTLRLTKTTPEILVNQFLAEYITETEDKKIQMTWQNMYYLWKMFLQNHHYPTSLFQSNIKTVLTQNQKSYKLDGDFFIGLASSQLPNIQLFLRFWNETMVNDELETDLEIEEIAGLFRHWGESFKWKNGYLNEKPILDAISYFFPEIEIENQKYIHRVRSSIWDKTMDIQVALQELALSLVKERNQTPSILSVYDAYLFYCKYYSNTLKKTPFLVSKTYFEKYMMDNFSEYISEDGILERYWIE
jgi:hypothetical protein